jgi:hypothetical protein
MGLPSAGLTFYRQSACQGGEIRIEFMSLTRGIMQEHLPALPMRTTPASRFLEIARHLGTILLIAHQPLTAVPRLL